MSDPALVAVAGDWHGATSWAQHAIQYARFKGATHMVQVGDFGLWPGPAGIQFLEGVNEACEQNDIDLMWLPGNHEDYDQIAEIELSDDPMPVMGRFSRIRYLTRGARWQWWGKNFMALGGAVSVDRHRRTDGVDYWPAEELTDQDVDVANKTPHGMDVIFSHDCPQGVSIPGIGPDAKAPPGSGWPADAMHDSQKSRIKLRRVWSVHRPQVWFHGHFHCEYEFWLGQTKFLGLDMNGSKMMKNVKFLAPEDLK